MLTVEMEVAFSSKAGDLIGHLVSVGLWCVMIASIFAMNFTT
jgi:hypothetical protein